MTSPIKPDNKLRPTMPTRDPIRPPGDGDSEDDGKNPEPRPERETEPGGSEGSCGD